MLSAVRMELLSRAGLRRWTTAGKIRRKAERWKGRKVEREKGG
jgi:hypothetical protein